MTYYQEITAVQDPFSSGTDSSNRVLFYCNYDCIALDPVTNFEKEIAKILSDAGLITLGTNTFIGPAVSIPDGNGPYNSLINTGGPAPLETHNGSLYRRLSIQIITRALDYYTARDKATAIFRALDGIRNTTITV